MSSIGPDQFVTTGVLDVDGVGLRGSGGRLFVNPVGTLVSGTLVTLSLKLGSLSDELFLVNQSLFGLVLALLGQSVALSDFLI